MTSKKRKEALSASQAPIAPSKKTRQEPGASSKHTLLAPHEPIIAELTPKYNVLTASIISSTQIRKRVSSAIEHLLSSTGASVVLLHARPAEVCKLITVVEQAKRVLKEKGKTCFQYNQLFELPEEANKRDRVEKTVLEDEAPDSEDDDDDFEVMQSRFEKAVLPERRQTVAKSMRVFLSTMAVPEIKAKDGVTLQTHELKSN